MVTLLISLIILLSVVIVAIRYSWKFYLYPDIGEALIRDGLGGRKISREEGLWFFSHFHILTCVPLTTSRIKVDVEALTQDKLRAKVEATFYLRVRDDDKSILLAAVALAQNHQTIRIVTQDKIESMLDLLLPVSIRVVASTLTYDQLLQNKSWVQKVHQKLGKDLDRLGLVLDTIRVDLIQA